MVAQTFVLGIVLFDAVFEFFWRVDLQFFWIGASFFENSSSSKQ